MKHEHESMPEFLERMRIKAELKAKDMSRLELSIWDEKHERDLITDFGFTEEGVMKRREYLINNAKPILLVVADENILGYIYQNHPENLNILHGSILRGATVYNGFTYTRGRSIRLASEKDFDDFRVCFDGYKNNPDYQYEN